MKSALSLTSLTLIPLTWKIGWASSNATKWQMGFNSAFKGLNSPANGANYKRDKYIPNFTITFLLNSFQYFSPRNPVSIFQVMYGLLIYRINFVCTSCLSYALCRFFHPHPLPHTPTHTKVKLQFHIFDICVFRCEKGKKQFWTEW